MKTNYFLLLLIAGILPSLELFSQDVGEMIPCQEITIGCRVVRGGDKYVIKNETEYQNFLQSKQSSLLNCTGNKHPAIDFSKFTLLGIVVGVAGCKEPSSEYSIYYEQQENAYVFELRITQHGFCEMLNHIDLWCLIPRISENSSVDFKIIYKPFENENK